MYFTKAKKYIKPCRNKKYSENKSAFKRQKAIKTGELERIQKQSHIEGVIWKQYIAQ